MVPDQTRVRVWFPYSLSWAKTTFLLLTEPIDFGILKWPTSAVCFGPPRVKRTSSLDLSDELGSGGGVGLESQGGVI